MLTFGAGVDFRFGGKHPILHRITIKLFKGTRQRGTLIINESVTAEKPLCIIIGRITMNPQKQWQR